MDTLTERQEVQTFKLVPSAPAGILADWKRRREYGSLQKLIENTLERVGQHESNGIESGHPYMVGLWARVDREIKTYAKTWMVPVEEIYRDCPAVTTIRIKADASTAAKTSPGLWIGLFLVSLVVLPTLFAVVHSIYTHVVKFLGG